MRKRIVVNAGLTETRVGVQEGNLLTELYLERHRHRSIVGSVYKGVVTNVLPGMQAAFVDIGLTKDAFLYAGDYTTNLGDFAGAMGICTEPQRKIGALLGETADSGLRQRIQTHLGGESGCAQLYDLTADLLKLLI